MLVANSISKSFGRTLALSAVNFTAHAGEIHALLGENGAGKTTLMNVIAGRLRPDRGFVTLDGVALHSGSPQAALRAGVACVHQSSTLFERLSWEENLGLGGFGAGRSRLDLAAVARGARALAESLGFALPEPGAMVEQCSVSQRVRLEVLRALSFNPRVLILDEPTGVLAPNELEGFLSSLRALRAQGRSIVLVTHKLSEAIAVADRITVLRRGELVMETTPGQTSEDQIARQMIGELELPAIPHPPSPSTPPAVDAAALELKDISVKERGRTVLDRISLTVRPGEIAGLAGVDGNGQVELVETLTGLRTPASGEIRVAGAALAPGKDYRLAVIPQNRDLDGLILDMPIWENLMLSAPLRARVTSGGRLNRARAEALCGELIETYRVRAPGPQAKASALSGGNRQRFEVARALAGAPAVLVAHNVCRGLDLVATTEVHRELRAFAERGGGLLLISSDLDELLVLCTSLRVINRGRVRRVAAEEREPGRLGMLMAGGWE